MQPFEDMRPGMENCARSRLCVDPHAFVVTTYLEGPGTTNELDYVYTHTRKGLKQRHPGTDCGLSHVHSRSVLVQYSIVSSNLHNIDQWTV